jgi:hypothetical protein
MYLNHNITNSTLRQKNLLVASKVDFSLNNKENTFGTEQPLELNGYTKQARAKLKLGNKNCICLSSYGRIIMSTYLSYL